MFSILPVSGTSKLAWPVCYYCKCAVLCKLWLALRISFKIFCHRFVKCCLDVKDWGQHITNWGQKIFNVDRRCSHEKLFCYISKPKQSLNKITFEQKTQCCSRGQCCPPVNSAYLLMSCDVIWTNRRYFALRYNKMYIYIVGFLAIWLYYCYMYNVEFSAILSCTVGIFALATHYGNWAKF